MLLDEMIDLMRGAVTASGTLPEELPEAEYARIIDQATRYFYRNYRYAQAENYWYIPFEAIQADSNDVSPYQQNYSALNTSKSIVLPSCIQAIKWVYEIGRTSALGVGIYAPNLEIGLGITNQPYLTSYVTSLAELATYRTVIQYFSSTLENKFNKISIATNYNPATHKLRFLGKMNNKDIIIHTYDNIPQEYLYEEDLFQRYCIGKAMHQAGLMITRYQMQLPGGVQINGDSLVSEGKEMYQAVETEINGMTKADFFFMKK